MRELETSAVLMGFLPGGFCLIMLISISPYWANAKDLGIGVAVIIKRSTTLPFLPNSSL